MAEIKEIIEKSLEDNFPEIDEFDKKDILAMEKESTGMYISGHPLDRYREDVEKCSSATIMEITENEKSRFNIGSKVTVSGIITGSRNQTTKKGEIMRYVELEDLTGSIEVIAFPNSVKKFDSLLLEGEIVSISGNLDMADDAPPKLRLEEICLLSDAISLLKNKSKKLYIRISKNCSVSDNEIKKIKEKI